jgi:hypothetical protein
LGREVVAVPASKQIGIESIGQCDTGDRHIGAKCLLDYVPFEKLGETSSFATLEPAPIYLDTNLG